MLQFSSCLIVGQFGEIVFAKISFDGVVVMSDNAGHLGTSYLRWNGAKISPGNVVSGCDITIVCAGSPQYCVLVANANKSVEPQVIVASCLL